MTMLPPTEAIERLRAARHLGLIDSKMGEDIDEALDYIDSFADRCAAIDEFFEAEKAAARRQKTP